MAENARKLPTKERIIEVAERLFAEKGLDATSMRNITDAAGVNLASINYHFGSKDGLIAAIFDRHLRPLNDARLAMLDLLDASTGDRPPDVEAVLEAFIRPAVALAVSKRRGKNPFHRLMGRCLSEPPYIAEKHVFPHFEAFIGRFNAALAKAVPGLTNVEVFWRGVFLAGSMHFALHAWSLENLPSKPAEPIEAEELIQQLISYAAAGMRSPRQ